MWPGFDSQMWVEFVCSPLCSERFFFWYSIRCQSSFFLISAQCPNYTLRPASSWFLLRILREKLLRATVRLSIEQVRNTSHPTWFIWHHFVWYRGKHYTAGSPKRSSYVAERTRKRQNKFTNSFYRFKFNLFDSWRWTAAHSKKLTVACSLWFLSRKAEEKPTVRRVPKLVLQR